MAINESDLRRKWVVVPKWRKKFLFVAFQTTTALIDCMQVYRVRFVSTSSAGFCTSSTVLQPEQYPGSTRGRWKKHQESGERPGFQARPQEETTGSHSARRDTPPG